MEKQYTHILLFVILIIILLYLHYNTDNKETFTTNTTSTPSTQHHVPNCLNPQFSTEGSGDDQKFCATVDGVGHGCQQVDNSINRGPLLTAFSIFGSYVDGLKTDDINSCMEKQGNTLSDWGLCDRDFLAQVKGFGYPENTPRIEAIERACEFYQNNTNNPKIQT